MVKNTHSFLKYMKALSFFFLFFSFLNQTNIYGKEAVLKKIDFNVGKGHLTLGVSERIPTKVIRVDDKEVLIALKNIYPERGIRGRTFAGNSLVKNFSIENLPGDVLAIVLNASRPIHKLDSAWAPSGLEFVVKFHETVKADTKNVKKDTPKRLLSNAELPPKYIDDAPDSVKGTFEKFSPSSAKKNFGKSESTKKTKKIKLGPRKGGSDFAGDINDLLLVADTMECASTELDKARTFLKKALWKSATEILSQYLEKDGADCRLQAEFFNAYAVLKQSEPTDSQALLRAKTLFQDILVMWPESSLIPFAYAALGIIEGNLNNSAAAEGFFTIVLDEYKNYVGMPEVLYLMGQIYDNKGYDEKALENYNTVFEKFPESTYAVDAGIGVGKALFRKLRYIESRDILSSIVASNPEKIYDSPDLLRSIGNAEFALGNSGPARKALLQLCNIFPDIEGKDMILTRIGDTYAIEKKLDRAKRIYKFVMEKYPGGEGFLNSAMGIALILEKRSEIEEIYNMVKKDFFDHRLSKVAMFRLAQLYNKEGEYLRCIEEVDALLANNPTGIRYDAVKLMQQAYESLFAEQLRAGEYPEVLKRYEDSQILFDRLESKKIYLNTGLSYLQAHLYEQAFNQLIKAYKFYKKSRRPPELLFGIAVAMDETGRKDDALKNFKAVVAKTGKKADKVQSYLRMGSILLEKNEFDSASASFAKAEKLSIDRVEKGNILTRHAEVYKRQENWARVSELITRAVNEFASAPGENYNLMAKGYRELGQSWINQKAYGNAVDAFALAVKFSSDGGNAPSDLEFMLGDAYQKGNNLNKAKETFEKVAGTDDSIWARLAKERLSTIDLSEKVSNS